MRICVISREYPPDTGWGGIATFAKHLVMGLTQLGHEVEVISLASGQAKTVLQDGVYVHRVEPFEVEGGLKAISSCMPYSLYVLQTSSALWQKFYELHQERPFDVVDTPELLAEGLVPAISKASPLLIRLYTPHSKFIAERLHNITPSFDHKFVALLERLAMLNADAITSPSHDLADFVANDLNYPREKIRIVRNPIDPQLFSPDGDKAIASDGRKIVLFVGRLEERKGIRYLIEAIPEVSRSVPNVRFVILGDDTRNGKGQKSVLAELKKSIHLNNCEQFVEFISRVPLAALPSYYRSADICVVPSVYDNSPYTCLEAMSCGKPVIGTSAGGTQEYITHDHSGVIVPAKDTQSLAHAIINLLGNTQEQIRLGNNARSCVLQKFRPEEIARQTVELYQEAQVSFLRRHDTRLYRKPPAEVLPDLSELLFVYDKMLRDLLYKKSIRFRLEHWWNQIAKRPRLTFAKLIVKLMKKALSIAGLEEEHMPTAIRQIEKEIETKQKEPALRR